MKPVMKIVYPIDVIRVTKRDIEKAEKAREKGAFDPTCECPVGQALQRIFDAKKKDIEVDWYHIRIGDVTLRFHKNKQLKNFVDRFDDGLFVEPLTFKLSELSLANDD